MRGLALVLVAPVLLLSGCAVGDEAEPGGGTTSRLETECSASLRALASYSDIVDDLDTPQFVATLTACGSADEWLAAARWHPESVGVADPDQVDTRRLDAACAVPDRQRTPVCRDLAG